MALKFKIMSRAIAQELASYLDHRAGEALRAVGHYSEDEYEVVHLRDDLRQQYTDEEIQAIVEDLRWESFTKSSQEGQFHLGGLKCSIQAFEEGVVMHFPYDDQHGTLVSLDPGAARDLMQFIDDCLTRIERKQDN
jgi:hypothetical protein